MTILCRQTPHLAVKLRSDQPRRKIPTGESSETEKIDVGESSSGRERGGRGGAENLGGGRERGAHPTPPPPQAETLATGNQREEVT